MAGVYHNSAYYYMIQRMAYTEMHIPDDPHFMRNLLFHPGDLGFKTIPQKKNWNVNLLSMVS
jgi:N-carbamoylputrescine amidase